ncbi:MAG: secretin N-terminal domain-containing protein [Phycisphaerales bacterium JB043]
MADYTTRQRRQRMAPLSAMGVTLALLAGSTNALAQERDPFGDNSNDNSNVEVSEFLTVDLHVQDEDLANVLQMLSIQSQRNIVMSNDVSATVTANLYNVTFFEALESILNVNGYGFIERGNFIYVHTLEEISAIEQAARQPVWRVINLDYLNSNDAAEFVTPLLSEIGQIHTPGETEEYSLPDDSPYGADDYAMSATLVVFDYAENVDEIEKLVEQLDSRPAQVLVEATILQSSLDEANAFGVDFSIIGSVDFTDFTNTGGPLSSTNSLIDGGTGASGEGVTPPVGTEAVSATSTAGNVRAGAGTFKAGIIQDDFAVFMRMLDEVTDISILSNPKVLTLNRQPARVLVGQRIGFLSTTSTETSTTQSVEFLDTGVQLSFRPFVSNDGFIRMELNPSVSEGVIREASNVNNAAITIPDENTNELSTNVLVRDGATIVLGGLFQEKTTIGRKQVPGLGNIPVVGAAFKGHDDEIKRSEIIFMITPTIVNDTILLEEGREGLDYVERVRTGSRRGLLPWSREKLSAKLNLQAERLASEGKSERANWKLRRSLQLNPHQPDALRLREHIMEKQERWPTRSMLEGILRDEINDRIDAMKTLSESNRAVASRDSKQNAELRRAQSKYKREQRKLERERKKLEKARAKAAAKGEAFEQPVVDANDDPENEGVVFDFSGGWIINTENDSTESDSESEATVTDAENESNEEEFDSVSEANEGENEPQSVSDASDEEEDDIAPFEFREETLAQLRAQDVTESASQGSFPNADTTVDNPFVHSPYFDDFGTPIVSNWGPEVRPFDLTHEMFFFADEPWRAPSAVSSMIGLWRYFEAPVNPAFTSGVNVGAQQATVDPDSN